MKQTLPLEKISLPDYSPKSAAAQTSETLNPVGIVVFLLLHLPLALAAYQNRLLSTLYALVTLLLGFVFLAHPKPQRLIYLTAYLTGAELIWRGTEAYVFYEFGKYSVSLLLILAILRYRRLKAANKAALVYFLLLLPSILVLPRFDRGWIAFNLAGPFALAVATMFFSTVELNPAQLKRLLLATIAPTVGLGFLTAFFTFTAEEIYFASDSLLATSADIGPNQVSSILGLGALAAFFYAVLENRHRFTRLLMIGLTIWLLGQAMLTFSRGGVWTTVGAILVCTFYLMRNQRTRAVVTGSLLILFLLGYFVVFAALNSFTSGALAARLSDTDLTGRDKVIKADLQIFSEHLLLGVGPQQSKAYHLLILGRRYSAHTEYSRMLAEHGLFGLMALLILLGMSAQRILKKAPPQQKAFSAMLTAWPLLFLFHSATRLVAPSFLFGLGAARLIGEAELDPNDA